MDGAVLPLVAPSPAWVQQVQTRQSGSLHWERVDRAPLGIWVNRPENRAGLVFEDIFDYRTFFELQMRILADTLSVGSDLTPCLALNNFGDGILASMFGADLVLPAPDINVIQDLGPWVVPLLHSAAEMAAVRLPARDAGLFPQVCDAVCYYRDHAPTWLPVVTPMRIGPLSVAMLLRGQSFYTDLYDSPDEIHHLLEVCTELFVETETYLFDLAGMSKMDTITNFGVSLLGAVRVGDDVIINLKPGMIEEFVVPYYRRIAQAFGGKVLLHFCSMPQARGAHVIRVLERHPDIFLGASTQLGVEYYLDRQGDHQGNLGMEAGYGVGISNYKQSFGSFRHWAEHLTRKRQSETGLILYTEVTTLSEAQQMWQNWIDIQEQSQFH